jgi:hypothetical protein
VTYRLYQQKAEPPPRNAPEAPPAPTIVFGWNYTPQTWQPARLPSRQQSATLVVPETPILANHPAGWVPPASLPTRRKRSVAGSFSEPREPTLREGSSSWRPHLPQPARRPRRVAGHVANAPDPAAFVSHVLAWWRPAAEPARPRARVAATHFALPPRQTLGDARFFQAASTPARRRPAGQSPSHALPLPPPLDPGPAQWSMRPAEPARRRRTLQPAASEPSAVWFWDVRADGWFRPASPPTRRPARVPPPSTASNADLLFREPTPERWLASYPPPRGRRRPAEFLAAASPGGLVAFETPLAGWLASLPALPSRRRRQAPGCFPAVAEILGWVVSPARWLQPARNPARRARPLPPPALAWAIYPGWDVPVGHWWVMTQQPTRRRERGPSWVCAAPPFTPDEWAEFAHGVGLVWRGHDAGRTWRGHDR